MPSMTDCIRSVGMLSKDELDAEAARLVGAVRLNTAHLIAHLAEIGDRGLALEFGYPSLFEYCVQRLGMSEAQTWLRLQVAKVCREFPALLESLAASRMSLTVAGRVAPHLTPDNAAEVIADCEGMKRREVDEYVVRFRPKREVGSGMRKVPGSPEPTMFASGVSAPDSGRGTAKTAAPASKSPRSRIEPVRPDRYSYYFSAGRALKEKLERLGEVLGVVNSPGRLEEILEVAVDIALEKKDPRRKQERRMKREAKKAEARAAESTPAEPIAEPQAIEPNAADVPRPDETTNSEVATPPTSPSRHLPAATRGHVMHRAGYQCEFVGPDGTRCSRRTGLQVDHVHPFAKTGHGPEGPHLESNLRCLCQPHNQWCAEQEFGRDFIRGKIEDERADRPRPAKDVA